MQEPYPLPTTPVALVQRSVAGEACESYSSLNGPRGGPRDGGRAAYETIAPRLETLFATLQTGLATL